MKSIRILSFSESAKFLPIAVVFFLALTLRMLYLYEIYDNPFFWHLLIDEVAYDQWAQRIAAGEWLGKEIFYQDPLYPYFLGVIYSVIGRDLLWVRVIQLFIGSLTCALIYLLGTSFFDRRIGFVAGVLAALYGPFFYFEAMFLKTFLGTFLICLFVLLLVVARPRRSLLLWVAAGVVLGLLALVRANTLAFTVAIVAWLFAANGHAEDLKNKLIAATGFFAGLLIVILVVFARNYIVGKDVVLLTSQAGQNFFIGNNPKNDTGRYSPPIFIRPNPRYEQQDFRIRAEINTGTKLGPSEVSRYWFGRAFSYMRQKPGHWLKLMWTKSRLFWNWYEVPDNQNFYFFRQYSFLLRMPFPDFRVVAALALTGMVLCARQWRKLLLPYLVVILYSSTVIAFYVFARYRLPVVPMLMLFAGLALVRTFEMISGKDYLRVGATAALACLLLLFLSMHVNPGSYENDRANAYCRLGSVYLIEEKIDDAISAYERASIIAPHYWASYYGLGEVYERKGKVNLALANYEKARDFNPGNVDVYVRIGNIFFNRREYEKSIEQHLFVTRLMPDWAEPHRWLANTYTSMGGEEQARVHLDKYRELKAWNSPDDFN